MLEEHRLAAAIAPQHVAAYLEHDARRLAFGEAGGVAHSDAVLAIAHAHQATPAQVRLAWTLHQGPHVLAIPGTGNPAHLVANVAAGALRLLADEVASLGS
jgi:aryl-alcohol dehydrogenase-like predicted oxidoreductase